MSPFVLFLLRLRIVRSLPILFALLIASAAQAQTGIALVQHAGKDGGTTTTTSLAFPSPNTVGNWIAVCVRGGFSSSQVFTIQDSNGNFYRRASQIGFTGSAVSLAIFYTENIIGGANTVTVSDTVSAPLRVAILEYSGVATSNSLDAAVAGTGNSASPGTPGLTTTADGDLLLSAIATTNPAAFRPGNGYAVSDFVPAEPNTKLIAEEQMQASAGFASADAFLSASDAWGAVLAAVKAAPNGTGSTTPSITGLSPTSGPVGASVTITGTNFGSTQDASTVQFNSTAGAPTSWSDTSIVAPVPNGATTGNVVVTVGSVPSNTVSFTVTTTAVAPTITAQPTNQTVTAGQTATFVVNASGTAPLGYQWQKNGANISSATSSTYTTPATTTSDSGSTFDVVVTNSAGSATSNPATLTVNAVPPAITAQPSNQTVTAGQTATFTVTASGTAPLSYQWQKNGANIAGATASSYITPATTTADSGSTFDVVVTNSAGSVTSNAATLTVNASAVAPTITTQPSNQTVTAGQTATFTVTANGTAPLSYQWQKNGANIAGATASSYTTPATTTADSGSAFDVIVTNSAGSVTSNAATLTVNASAVAPTITTQPSNQTVTAGQTATFTVTANGTAPLTYQWQKNGANIAGATASSYTTPATTTADNGSAFDVVVNNSAGTATSSSATLTVNASVVAPTITAQPAGQTVTEGQTATFTVSASGTAPLGYQWQKNGANISGATSSSYTTPATATSDSGSTFDAVVSNSAGTATSAAATLTVNSTSNSSVGWKWIQDSPLIFCQGSGRTNCNPGLGNIVSTVAGSVWILQVQAPNNVRIQSINPGNGGGTWIYCAACHVTNPNGFTADAWYNLTGNAGFDGANPFGFTLSGSAGTFLSANFVELLPPPGATASFDAAGTAAPSGCTTCTAAGLGTLSGTDAIWQNPGGGPNQDWKAWSAPYFSDYNGGGVCLDCTSGAAPTKTFGNTNQHPEFMAIAFTSTAGTFTPPPKKYSIVNFTAVDPATACSSCTISIPATTAGNLLFVEAANEAGIFINTVSGGGTWVVPPGCQAKLTVQGQNNAASCAYNLSVAGGVTSITVNMSGSAAMGFAVTEISAVNAATWSLDAIGASLNTPNASCGGFCFPGQALTLNGGNDVVFQLAWDVGQALGPNYYPQPQIPSTSQGHNGPGGLNAFAFQNASIVIMTDTGATTPTPTWINAVPNQNTFVTGVAFTAH